LDDFNDDSNDDSQDESFIKEVEDIVKNGVKLKGKKLLDVHESIIKYNDSSKTNKLALVQEDGSVILVDNNYPNSLLA
jgi:hypothetical protein